jgi:hypothetical protein
LIHQTRQLDQRRGRLGFAALVPGKGDFADAAQLADLNLASDLDKKLTFRPA